MRKIVTVAMLLLALTSASYPAYDPGGSLVAALAAVSAARDRGEVVVIDSACLSACALKLAAPRVCLMPDAQIGVHEVRATRHIDDYPSAPRDEMGTALFRGMIPPCPRALFDRLGGFASGRLVTLSGAEILAACPQIGRCR